MTVLFKDTFTEAADTAMAAHTPDVGSKWQPLLSNASFTVKAGVGYANGTDNYGKTFYTPTTMTSADYAVKYQVRRTTGVDPVYQHYAVLGRIQLISGAAGSYTASFYRLRYNADDEKLYLERVVSATSSGGTVTQLATAVSSTLWEDTDYTLELRMVGSTISGYVNGTLKITGTDSTITSAGYPGVNMTNSKSLDFEAATFGSTGLTWNTVPNFSGSTGNAFSQSLTSYPSNGTAPLTYTIDSGTLPAGLSLSSAGVISGTPTAEGTFTIAVKATDSTLMYGTSNSFNLVISKTVLPLAFSGTIPNQNSQVTVPYSSSAASYFSNGVTPYVYSLASGALPPGLTLNSATGTVSGTPTTAGTYAYAIRVTDANSNVVSSNSITHTVAAAPPPQAVFFSGQVPPVVGEKGKAFSVDLSSYFNGTLQPFTYTLTGVALPAGAALGGSVLSGVLTTAQGLTGVKVRATDTGGNYAETNLFNILINDTLAGATSTLPLAGVPYEFYLPLVSQSDTKNVQLAPTLAVGDVKVSKDGGALANIATLPQNLPAGSSWVKVSLSADEMSAGHVLVAFRDQAGAEWCSLNIDVATSLAAGMPEASTGSGGLTAEQTRAAVWDLPNTGARVPGSAGAQLQDTAVRIATTTDT